PPVLAISTQVTLSPRTRCTRSSASRLVRSSAIAVSSVHESNGAALVRHLSHLCIEQAALTEPRLERARLLFGHSHEKTAARLRVTHQCVLPFRNRQADPLAEGLRVAHRPLRAVAAGEVLA